MPLAPTDNVPYRSGMIINYYRHAWYIVATIKLFIDRYIEATTSDS